jgi:tRNA uracil 4-sulfurtransferase
MYDGIIIHYNEIAIKGQNRSFFENKLISNINQVLNQKYKFSKKYGLIYIDTPKIKETEIDDISKLLECIPGIAHFSFVKRSILDIEQIKLTSCSFLNNFKFNTFKVETKRSNKQFELKSPEINKIVGESIIINLDKKVDIKEPDLVLFIEIIENQAYFFIKKIKGVGGLPIGSGGKVVCSLSGGIDSPVSAYLFMRRGFSVQFVHIYNNTLVKKEIVKKIKELVSILNKFQIKSKLYIVPFSEIQKQIIANVHSDYRMIIYRRYMFKIIEKIAIKENAKAIITGDNIAQVASQTIENLTTIYSSVKLPIFSPLIAFDKKEIISIAKKIDTYNTSIIPYPDCCSYMISKHPKTKTNIEEVLLVEKNIEDAEKLISSAIDNSEIIVV